MMSEVTEDWRGSEKRVGRRRVWVQGEGRDCDWGSVRGRGREEGLGVEIEEEAWKWESQIACTAVQVLSDAAR